MSPVEDIILNGQAPQKKKGKGILVILFLLVIILIVLVGAYWYYINYIQETPKAKFFKHVGQNNFNSILDIDLYYTMLGKINEQSHKTETTANFTTTKENETLQGIDVSKLEFVLNTNSNKENNSALLDATINYSSNNLFNLKLISTQESVGIGSTEVLDKYIATSKPELSNSIERAVGYENDLSADMIDEGINNIAQNKVDLEDEYKTQKINEYLELTYNLIPEEAVTENENVVVTIDSQTINTKAYTLNLEENAYKEILRNALTTLKNDTELLGKIVTGTERQVEYTEGETEQHQTSSEVGDVNANETEGLEIVKDLPDENLVKDENVVTENVETEVELEETELQSKIFESLISVLVLNQKIEGTVDDLVKDIDLALTNIDNLSGDVVITVYVRNEEEQEEKTVKIIGEFPENTSIDIEYPDENTFKITSLGEVIENEETNIEGTSIELQRTASDVKTEFNIQMNDIKNQKVIAKTQIELQTEGSKTSNKYENELIIKYNDSEEDFKLNIKNNIDFENVEFEDVLNDENAIFIDKLSDEDVATLYTQVSEKIMQLIFEKVINLNFINSNTISSTIQQPVIQEPTADKSVVKQELINAVSNMMGQAQQNGETFTIEDLKDLQIDGFNVSCVITEEVATIKIGGYTFTIDKDFMLSE